MFDCGSFDQVLERVKVLFRGQNHREINLGAPGVALEWPSDNPWPNLGLPNHLSRTSHVIQEWPF